MLTLIIQGQVMGIDGCTQAKVRMAGFLRNDTNAGVLQVAISGNAVIKRLF